MQPDCLQAVAPDPLPSRDLTAATVMIFALFIAVAVFEWWAMKTQRRTISQRIQKLMKGHLGWQILALVGFGLLGWHLILGGPL